MEYYGAVEDSNSDDDDPMAWGRTGSAHGFRCAKCRMVLAYAAHVVPHTQQRPLAWWDDGGDESAMTSSGGNRCPSGLFVLQLPWMQVGDNNSSGRLHCAGCDTKLGNIRLGKGDGAGESSLRCPCGASTSRGVWMNLKKVDKFIVKSPS
jgi:hypothetical protein